MAARHVAETDMNARSSRSHTIFKIVIESRDGAEAAERKPVVTQVR